MPKDIRESLLIQDREENSFNSKTEFDPNKMTQEKTTSRTDQYYNHTDRTNKYSNQDLLIVDQRKESPFVVQKMQKGIVISENERLKNMLEQFIKDQHERSMSPNKQRELQHLVQYVQKIQNETEECTFHPSINPKTLNILKGNPAYQMRNLGAKSKSPREDLYYRLHYEGEAKKQNMTKFDEIRERKELVECTFSPRTNSPLSAQKSEFSPENAYQRLHYADTELRQEKLSKKETEKMDKFRQDYPFQPERSKTKKKDHILIKHNKENDENMYERMYKVHQEKEEKLQMIRQAKEEQEKSLMNQKKRSRSKSHKKIEQVNTMQSWSSQQQFTFSPSSPSAYKGYQQLQSNMIGLPNQTLVMKKNQKNRKQKQNFSQTMSYQGIPSLKSQQTTQSNNAFSRLYLNAQQSQKRRDKLRNTIDQELGISFSPQLFKSPKKLQSPQKTVIERNEDFQRAKLQKLQEQEDLKNTEFSFEPQLVSRRNGHRTQAETSREAGDRLYQNAVKQEEKKARKKLEIEQMLKKQYLKTRKNQ